MIALPFPEEAWQVDKILIYLLIKVSSDRLVCVIPYLSVLGNKFHLSCNANFTESRKAVRKSLHVPQYTKVHEIIELLVMAQEKTVYTCMTDRYVFRGNCQVFRHWEFFLWLVVEHSVAMVVGCMVAWKVFLPTLSSTKVTDLQWPEYD